MMRLLCDGVVLDLYDNANLQFKKSNPAFAFGEMSSERTTQFKLPCTPTNDKVLGLARIPAYDGCAMRKKFAAQLQCGSVVKNGFLYVSDFDGKDYTAILVAGLAYDIKAFGTKDWGSLLLTDVYDGQTIYNSNASSIPMVAKVKFKSDAPAEEYGWQDYLRYQPSIDIRKLLSELNSQGVFKISGLSSGNIRLLRNERADFSDILVTAANSGGTLSTNGNGVMVIGQMEIEEDEHEGTYESAPCFSFDRFGSGKVTFPDDMPENLCVCYSISESQYMDSVGFIGSRRFNYSGYYGEPLAGQTIDLEGHYSFMLLDMSACDFPFDQDEPRFTGDFSQIPTYNLKLRYTPTEINPYFITEHSMIADLSLADLLKIYSAATGRLINVKADGSVQFISSLNATAFELNDIVSFKSVKRTFSDYAQNNIVRFKESNNVNESEQIKVEYQIENDNIEEEKELLKLNPTEGGLYDDGTDNLLYVRGMKPERDEGVHAWIYTLTDEVVASFGGNEFLQRISLTKSNLLQTLCDKSTQFVVDARMSLAQFSAIDSATCLLVRGTKYTWVEASWQNDVASITLQKMQ